MADNLESFFKKHLSDASSGGDNWNIPSESVWEKALPEIHKKSGIFIPWKYLILLGFITFVGIAIVIFFWNYQISDIPNETRIAELETKSIDTNSNKEIATDSDSPNLTANTHIINIDLLNEPQETIKTKTSPAIDQKSNSIDNERNIVVSEDSKSTDNSLSNYKNEFQDNNQVILTEDKTQIIPNDEIINENSPVEIVIQTINQEELSIAPENNPVDSNIKQSPINPDKKLAEPYLQSEDKNEPVQYKNKIGIGVFYSPTYTSTYFKGDMIPGIENTSPVYLFSGYYGFDFKYYFSDKFAIVLGAGRSEIKSWSKSSVDFDYDTSTEHIMDNGDKENTSPLPMPTPFGEINTEITYRFSGSNEFPNGEIMQSEQETHQSIKYLTIPLGAEYNIIHKSRLTWFAEGGLRYNQALKDATNFSSRILHDGDDMNVMSEEIKNNPNYKNFYIDYYLGTGISYPLNKSLHIQSSARYFGNLTEVNIQEAMSTNVRGFGLKLGIIYFF